MCSLSPLKVSRCEVKQENHVHVSGMYFDCPLAASTVKSSGGSRPNSSESISHRFYCTYCSFFCLCFLTWQFVQNRRRHLLEPWVICMSLIAIAFSRCGYPCGCSRAGACCCSAEGSRTKHDLFTVLCCTMCFTYNNRWFVLFDDAKNGAKAFFWCLQSNF